MIMGNDRLKVIENIKEFAQSGQFHNKVELNDPVLTSEENKILTDEFIENRKTLSFKVKTFLAVSLQQIATRIINKETKIIGFDKIPKDLKGVIITSNHFGPLENTVIRHLANKMKRKKLAIISQTTNFKMTGFLGFLMNYANTIPIYPEPRYLVKNFLFVLKDKLINKEEAVLLYPEQEMWFNYRKPRPPKNGAYFYAAKLNVPIISCFVEMIDQDKDDNEDFKKVTYVLHVLDVLYPDKDKTVKENMEEMAEKDYQLKKERYEKVYFKPLKYDFQSSDIAGWKGQL